MERQLHLLADQDGAQASYRRLDAKTKAVGRRGLAQARAALSEALRADDDTESPANEPSPTPDVRPRRRAA